MAVAVSSTMVLESSPQSSTDGSPRSSIGTGHSTPLTECDTEELAATFPVGKRAICDVLSELFAENVIAKALRTAHAALPALPHEFPEIVPMNQESDGKYSLRPADFWTCGFFPGTLYAVLERLIKYPQSVQASESISKGNLRREFASLCEAWIEPIRKMDSRTDTHDLGFIIMPALRADWELLGNQDSLASIIRAAHSLATRYVPSSKAIRSWDLLRKKDVEILDQESNMIVIIDSLCNLDLLYYAAHHSGDLNLAHLATEHAKTVLRTHLRPEKWVRPWGADESEAYQGQWYSTCHVANLDPRTGELKQRLTAQGYSKHSTWSRGQAWAIMGYVETYGWTKDGRFIEAACGLAEYFLHRLWTAPESVLYGRHVPLWDFDAPLDDERMPLRDSSAGTIAANGLLVLSQALLGVQEEALASRYSKAAFAIIEDTLDFALASEKSCLVQDGGGRTCAEEVVPGIRFDGILKFATANNNATAKKRYADHALVYGDYYLVEFGNKLLRMGLA